MLENDYLVTASTLALSLKARRYKNNGVIIDLSAIENWDQKTARQATELYNFLKEGDEFGRNSVSMETPPPNVKRCITIKRPDDMKVSDFEEKIKTRLEGFADEHSIELYEEDPAYFQNLVRSVKGENLETALRAIVGNVNLKHEEQIRAVLEIVTDKNSERLRSQLKPGRN